MAIKFVPRSVIRALQTILDMHQSGIPSTLKLVKAAHLRALLEEHDRNEVLIRMMDERISDLEGRNTKLNQQLSSQRDNAAIRAAEQIRGSERIIGSRDYQLNVKSQFDKRKSMGKTPLLKVKPIEGAKNE